MFEQYDKYRTILVTGPHRSGTTIAAKMIAHDTGHDLVLEDEFQYSNPAQFAAFLQADYGPQVIQCPFMAHIIHDLPYLFDTPMDDMLVVFMRRPVDEIMDSEKRAKLKDGTKVAFDVIGEFQKHAYHVNSPQHVAEVRYDAWEVQRRKIPHWTEVEYHDLNDHPLWIANRNFSVRQTEPDVEPDVTVRAPFTLPIIKVAEGLF